MRNMDIYYHCEVGECRVIFDGDIVVDVIDANDADIRIDYLYQSLRHFGVNLNSLPELNEIQMCNLRDRAPEYFEFEEE